MSVSRPLNKELLKKLFLKTLHETRPGGRLDHHGSSVGGILTYIPVIFPELGTTLLEDEKPLALRGVFELERDGYVWQNHTQSPDHKVLSDLGNKVVNQELADMELPSIDIDHFISREDLRAVVRDDFISIDYDTAIFKAFRFLEESVRAKAKEPASSLGVALMNSAFSPGSGKLKHPGAAVTQEQEGLHHLMRGAIMWFKNPSSHRTVPRDDAVQAAQVLAFANMLLDLLDECA